MSLHMPPPEDVLTVLLTSWTAGTALFAALTRLGGEVDPGHFKVVWLVAAGLGAVTVPVHRPAWVAAAVCAAAFAAIYLGRDREAGSVAAAVSLGVAALAASRRPEAVPVAATEALLLGAVTNAMLLGHWHLNQPRLGTGPLRRLVAALWAGLAAYGAAAGAVLVPALQRAQDAAVVGAATALAFTAFAAVLTALVTHLVRARSIMSATGILYLEVLLCFVAAFTGSLGALGLRTP